MTNIVITDITTGIVDGTGIFDKLMASVKAHIHDEYDNGRIKGPEYSQVYLGAIQAVLNQSVQFALQEKQTEAQVDLLVEQKKVAYVERVIKDKEAAALGMDKVVKVANTSATTEAIYIPKYEEV